MYFLEFFFDSLNIVFFITLFLLSLILLFYYPKIWQKFIKVNLVSEYQNIQRIHFDEVPRLGGVFIFIYLIIYSLFDNLFFLSQNLNSFLLCTLPIFFVTLKEDLCQNTSPNIRLLSMTVSSFLVIYFLTPLFPNVDISFFNSIFSSPIALIIFYIACMVGLMNGMNFIDGANGILSFYIISAGLSLIFLSLEVNDLNSTNIFIYFLIPYFIFLFFNFPFGKIFLGDFGAYFSGFILGIFLINFFAQNPEIYYLNAGLIFFYPIFELVFSFSRKIFFEKISPFQPDNQHLHSIIYSYLYDDKYTKSNYLVTIILLPIIFLPTLFLYIFYNSPKFILLSIIFMVMIYLFYYFFFKSILKKK